MRAALLALGLLSAACHGKNPGPPAPEERTTLKVQNQNFRDMTVFVVRDGQRIRLGLVAGLSTQVLTIPPDLVRGSPQLLFEVHPIGGRVSPRTEKIAVQPGDEVEISIAPS